VGFLLVLIELFFLVVTAEALRLTSEYKVGAVARYFCDS